MDDLHADDRLSLDQLQEQYALRHGVGVAFLKQEVGAGDLYENPAARALISGNGAWFECLDLPMEFTGLAGGPVPFRFPNDADVIEAVHGLYSLCHAATVDNTRLISLFILYTRRGILDGKGIYAFHLQGATHEKPGRPVEIGHYDRGALPLAARCRIDTNLEAQVNPGAVFCLTGIGERNLWVELPYEGTGVRDLANPPISPSPQ